MKGIKAVDVKVIVQNQKNGIPVLSKDEIDFIAEKYITFIILRHCKIHRK
jgi:hypothetical protein